MYLRPGEATQSLHSHGGIQSILPQHVEAIREDMISPGLILTLCQIPDDLLSAERYSAAVHGDKPPLFKRKCSR